MENITFTILGIETFLFILDLLNFYRIKSYNKKKENTTIFLITFNYTFERFFQTIQTSRDRWRLEKPVTEERRRVEIGVAIRTAR